MFRIQVYPAKNPNGLYVNKDQQGQTFDVYLVYDSNKTWRMRNDWTRIIKAECLDGYYTISSKKAYKTLDQHDKDVIAYINTNYPLPQ